MLRTLFLFLLFTIGQSHLANAADDTESAIALYNAQDYHAAFSAFEKLAETDLVAQYYLANMYAGGQGTEPNKEKSFHWFLMSAEQGHPKAQFKTGLAYNEGFGTKKDPATAISWFEKAADQGVPEAQFYLAVAYQQGELVEKDLVKAVKWLKLAAKQGIPEAQNNLANFYNEGMGVRQDNELAFAWYSIATLSGNEQAEINQQMLSAKMTQQELDQAQKLAEKIYSRMQESQK
ncbi:MAG: tetratricopeptide repeat protein [Gammaproteobacteria bacterium]